ncbi:hypothetical protein EON77_00385 [bacterium]|nr:MAG: hypothetical protein EON77_00385 [bacterium]
MRPRAVFALARGVILESIRRKDLWVVAILGFLIILCAGALGFFGVQGLEIFVKDLGVTVLGVFGSIIAVLTSCRVLPDEVKNRTLYPLLARPISRFGLVLGKFLGAVAVSWIAFVMLAALTTVALAIFRVPFEPVMLQYLVAKMMGLVVVCALSMALSVLMTPSAAATTGFIFVFGSSMIVRALVMGYDAASPPAKLVFRLLSAALPQLNLFDLGGRVTYVGWGPVPLWVMGALFAYMALYSSAMIGMAWARFRRQAL